MQRILTGLLVAMMLHVSTGGVAVAWAATPIKVFLFGGQSNMRGTPTGPPSALRNQEEVLYSYNVSGVVGNSTFAEPSWTALDALPPNSAGQFIGATFGPELSAGKALADGLGATPDDPIAIIKVARDGSRIVGDFDSWRGDAGGGVRGAVNRVFFEHTLAALQNPVNGEPVAYEVAGMFWMQGESDANPLEGATPARFRRQTELFIASVREAFNAPSMPFFIGELHDFDGSGDAPPYRAAQLDVALNDPNTYFVETVGLTRRGGGTDVHFDRAGTIALGERFAAAYFNAVPEPSASVMVGVLAGCVAVRSSRSANCSPARNDCCAPARWPRPAKANTCSCPPPRRLAGHACRPKR